MQNIYGKDVDMHFMQKGVFNARKAYLPDLNSPTDDEFRPQTGHSKYNPSCSDNTCILPGTRSTFLSLGYAGPLHK